MSQKNTNEEISLNVTYGEDEGVQLQDTIEDKNNSYFLIEERVYIQQLREDLEQVMLNYTTLKEREIIKLKYGWDDNEDMSDREVGEVFNLTQYQIADIRNRAFYKIRKSSWGARMAREMYMGKKKQRNKYSINELINTMDFARRYHIDEVNL